MARISLKCFGVGDGWPSADRHHSAYLYRFPGASFLIDCGEPISSSYKGSGLNCDLIDSLFLSHLHFDHVGGFFMLMQSFWLEGRKKQLAIHTPEEGVAALRQMLTAGYLFDELLPFPLRFEPLREGGSVHLGGARVTPVLTTHLKALQATFASTYPRSYQAFSFLVESEHHRLGHSADIGAVEDLQPLLEKPLDLLVCELAHVQPEGLFAFLSGRPIHRILFVHLARELQARLDDLQKMAKRLLGPIALTFPQDGDEFVL